MPQQIRALLADPAGYRALSDRSLSLIRQEFAFEVNLQRLQAMFAGVA